ncbi:MAG: hypothetical protein EXS60_01730 [Candidatus Pacebacteria bacterium]|nr:hypothetical protein [Candidatus Paceibacterota bacterium]
MKDIKNLTKRIIAFRDARDWKQFHNPKDVALSLVLEATEVMEHFQWNIMGSTNHIYSKYYPSPQSISVLVYKKKKMVE